MDNTRVNIDEFIKKYDSYTATSAKEAYFKQMIKPTGYVPFVMQCFYADGIIKASCYDKDGNIHFDSAKKYIQYVFTLLRYYTNFDVQSDNFVEQYDVLASRDLIEKIINIIPDINKKTLDTVLQMKTDDIMTNEYEPHAFITKKITDLQPSISDGLNSLLDNINKVLTKDNLNKIVSLLKE